MSQPSEATLSTTGEFAAGSGGAESFWSSVREALHGSHRDYTQGPIGRAILLLAIPMVLEMVMESVFAVCDVFFVSHLGVNAVAAVGLTESMLTIVYAIAIGLSIGASAMVARRIGEKDREGAAQAAVHGITLGLVVALLLGSLGAMVGPRLLALMGASQGVLDIGSGYVRMMLGGQASILLLFLINAIFRGAGDPAISMRSLWLANAINIGLGPCLIFGVGPFPRLGVVGAAIATTIGRGTGALYGFSRLLRRQRAGEGAKRIDIHRRHLRIDFSLLWRLLRLSSSGMLQAFIGTSSWVGLVRLLSTFGSAALAGYTIGIRIIVFALLPAWGLGNAAATMVGQALGAKKPERAEKAVWLSGTYNLYFLGAVGLLFVIFTRQIVGIFTSDPEVASYAIDCLRIVAAGFVFYSYGMVLAASFNGAGDTWTPTMLNLIVFWLWEIPLAWFLAKQLSLGPRGIFVAIAIAFSTLAVSSAWLFRRGKWKLKHV
jgi:MATE family, multidrug efflux pump